MMIKKRSKFNWALGVIILTLLPSNCFAGGGGGAEEDTAPVIEDKSKLLLSIMKEGHYSHVGGIEAINLLTSRAIKINPNIENGNSLDVGCGFGGTAGFLQDSGFSNMWGIDIDEKAIEHSKHNYPNVNFATADATKLTDMFENEFFSFVYMFNVASEIPDKAALLQKIKSVCKDGSILAIFDYTLADPKNKEELLDHAGLPIYPINMEHLNLLLRVIGWEVIETTDITSNYQQWYTQTLEKISSRKDMLKATGYSDAEIQLVQDNFNHMLKLMKDGKINGTILIAKKV